MPKRVEVNKTLRGRMKFKGRLLQKQTNSATKLQKKRCKFTTRKKQTQKLFQNLIWEGLGLHLGRVWDALERLGATFGRILTACWTFQNHIFLKQWSKMGSKRPFGWLLDRLWKGLGRIWMHLGRIWAFKIKAFASHGHFLNTLGVPCCLTLRYKNPRAASLRLAERHNLFF